MTLDFNYQEKVFFTPVLCELPDDYWRECLLCFERTIKHVALRVLPKYNLNATMLKATDYANEYLHYYIKGVIKTKKDMMEQIEMTIIKQLSSLPSFKEDYFEELVSIEHSGEMLTIGFRKRLLIKPKERKLHKVTFQKEEPEISWRAGACVVCSAIIIFFLSLWFIAGVSMRCNESQGPENSVLCEVVDALFAYGPKTNHNMGRPEPGVKEGPQLHNNVFDKIDKQAKPR